MPKGPAGALKGRLRSPLAAVPQSQILASLDSSAFLTGRMDWMIRLRGSNSTEAKSVSARVAKKKKCLDCQTELKKGPWTQLVSFHDTYGLV